MTQLNYSGPLLAASANYKASDFAGATASGGVNLEAVAQFNRGIQVALGADALVQVDAYFRKFLAADLMGQANATARIAAEVRAPLNLFDRAGVVVALDARAEVAASVQLALGLNIGDFLALAREHADISGSGMRLLEALLSEPAIKGGVMAKAAAAAMAYASLECTASLFETPRQKAGIQIAASAGLGLKAGAGFKGFVEIELVEPRRLVRRVVDILVDDSMDAFRRGLGSQHTALVDELRPYLKIAFRSCFEIGHQIAATGSGRPIDGQVLAQRCVQVALEEMQRSYFGAVIGWAQQVWQNLLAAAQIAQQQWAGLQQQRYRLADRLEAIETLAIEDTSANRTLWLGVFDDGAAFGSALPAGPARDRFLDALAGFWCAVELLFAATRQASEASARAQLLGQPLGSVTASFTGPLPVQPPQVIKDRVRTQVGGAGNLKKEDLTAFLLDAVVLDGVVALSPRLGDMARLLAGSGMTGPQAIRLVVKNANRLTAGDGSAISLDAALTSLTTGLREAVLARVESELRPAVANAGGGMAEASLYFEEVLMPGLRISVNEIFGAVLGGVRTGSISPSLLSEACSAIVLRMLSRSMVVTADIILDHTLRQVGSALKEAGRHVNDTNGLAHEISKLARLDRATIAGALEETFSIMAEVFVPLPPGRRARIRALAIECGDFLLANPEQGLIQGLRDQGAMGNPGAGQELAMELGKTIADRIQLAITVVIARIEQALLELISDFVRAAEQLIAQWEQDLQQLVADLQAEVQRLFLALDKATRDAERAWNRTVDAWLATCHQLASQSGREKLQVGLVDLFYDQAKDILASNPVYKVLPPDWKKYVRGLVKSAISTVVEGDPADAVLAALGSMTAGAADFVEDLRNIKPGDDLAQAVLELFLDRMEDGLHDAIGDSLDFNVTVSFEFFGKKTVQLGSISVLAADIVKALRGAARDVDFIGARISQVAGDLAHYFNLEELAGALSGQHETANGERDHKARLSAEARLVDPRIEFLSPRALGSVAGDVPIVIRLAGIPESMLGRQPAEVQRVFVWLNDQQIDLDLADVEVQEAVPQGASAIKTIGVVARPLAGAVLDLRPARASIALAARRGSLDSGAAFAAAPKRGRVTPASLQTRHAFNPGLVGRAPTLLTGIGRPTRLSDIAGAAAPQAGVIVVRIRIAQNLVKPGINTLSAWVTDGGGERRTSVRTSFVVEAAVKAPARPKPVPGRRLVTVVPAPSRRVVRETVYVASHSAVPLSGKIDWLAAPIAHVAALRREAPLRNTARPAQRVSAAAHEQLQSLRARGAELLHIRATILAPDHPPEEESAMLFKGETK